MPPNLSRSEKARQRNAEQRQAKFAAVEAAKAPEDRLINRKDFDDFIYRQLGAAREAAIVSMRLWFTEFLMNDNIKLCSTQESAEAYFTKGGPAISTRILRMFLEYMLDSRTGKLTEENPDRLLHYSTLHHYVDLLKTTAKRARNPVEPTVANEAHDWIDFHLIRRKLVNTVSRKKEMTTTQDVTSLLRLLFSVEYTARFANTRNVLNLALFITMAIDCCGRASELISPRKSSDEKYFRWCHFWAYAFPTPMGPPTIKAKAQFKDLKNPKPDPSKNKTIPLRLLPIELAAEDTLRHLITLGLMDGVFEDIESWADIDDLDPHPEGTLLRIKPSEMNKPVSNAASSIFRLFLRSQIEGLDACTLLIFTPKLTLTNKVFRRVDVKHQVTDEPLRYHNIRHWLRLLGRAAGFEGPMLTYALRRGIAYLLAMNCTKEERLARMGHKDGEGVYWRSYRNQTSTVDFQAIAHRVDAEDVSMLSSISLNRRADAPTKLSEEGYRTVYNDPAVSAATTREMELLDSLLETYRTLDNAKRTDRDGFQRYDEARVKARAIRETLRGKLFQEEYRAHFNAPCPKVTVEKSMVPSADPGPPKLQAQSTASMSPSLDGDDEDLDEVRFQQVIEVDESNIDPQLLQNAANAIQSMFDEADAASEQSEDTTEEKIPARPIVETRSLQLGYSKVLVAPWTVTDAVSRALLGGQDSSLSRSELGDAMIEAFNHLYISDQFYPSQHPLPGANICRFCTSALPVSEPQVHARACEKRQMVKQLIPFVESRYPVPEECDWTNSKGEYCGRRRFKDHVEFSRHLNNHTRKNVCRFGACAKAIEAVEFESSETFYCHLLSTHALAITFSQKADNAFQFLVYWCGFCCRWLSQLEEDMDGHASGHCDTVYDVIRIDGYAGVELASKMIQPALCPFCVHNPTLEPAQRFRTRESQRYNSEHITKAHLKGIEDDELTQCPASTNAADGIPSTCDNHDAMTKAELIEHLDQAHSLKPWITPIKRVTSTDAEAQGTGSKKTKADVRRVLQPKSVNTHISHLMKSAASMTTSGSKPSSSKEPDTLFVGDDEE